MWRTEVWHEVCRIHVQVQRKALAKACAVTAGALVLALLFGNRFGPRPDPTHPLASTAALVIGVAGVTGLLQPAVLTYNIFLRSWGFQGGLQGC